ncbi:hypothetical protein RHGRI_026637 [Rhododendron griersonianum]|uniref:Uncharacterized protein n=1 Tax=Rhododendron griersonianum TaxID=479676 RepID=A0AAV6IVV5_9ERIC|nr:hypothetical protein RHGRI_026637 [Rhododendron griersonianum]
MNGAVIGSRPYPLSPKQPALWKGTTASNTQRSPSSICTRNRPRIRALSLEEIPPNALCRERDPNWWGGFSLGVDLGMSRTGLAVSKGFSFRPLTDVDGFIIGLPKSWDGKETKQSNKVRSIAGRFAVRAAERGWRVYLLDEHGTSTEAMSLMIEQGLSKSARQGRIDAYAAVMVLERYFELSGQGIELVLPKQLELQEKLRIGREQHLDLGREGEKVVSSTLKEEVAKARVRQVDEKGKAYGTGRRKCSIARVWIQPGDGIFVVNEKEFDVYFPMLDHRAALLRPFSETKTLGLWNIDCTVKGGGVSGIPTLVLA